MYPNHPRKLDFDLFFIGIDMLRNMDDESPPSSSEVVQQVTSLSSAAANTVPPPADPGSRVVSHVCLAVDDSDLCGVCRRSVVTIVAL